MPRVHDLQPSFNAGEISPRLAARLDFNKYKNGLELCQNFIPMSEGGITNRSGTRHVAELKSSNVKGRLKGFQFSVLQSYILEFGERIMRFFRFQGQISVATTDAVVTNGNFNNAVRVPFDHVWQVDDTPADNAFVDQTANANSAAAGDWPIFPTSEAVGDYAAFGLTTPFSQIRFNSTGGTAGNNGLVTWEYWNGTIWTALSGVSDGTNNFQIATSDNQLVSWVRPTDWVARTISTSASLYWVRARITNVYPTNPIYTQGTIRAVWIDRSTGNGTIDYDAVNLDLDLIPGGTAGTDIAVAQQPITTTNTGQEHVIKFRVKGDPGDKIEFQVGTTHSASDTLAPLEKSVGWHCVPFTPSTSPFHIQFRNLGSNANKTVSIDDVSLISGAPIEIDTPWTESVLYNVEGPQSADVLYLFEDNVPTHKLLRMGHTHWGLVEVAWQDGPYLDENTTATTLTPSATSGVAVTVTASSVTGINGGLGFQTTDVGRLVRISNPAMNISYGWGVIVARSSTTVVSVHVKKNFSTTGATTRWRLGAWSSTTGYPQTAEFFEQRLYAAATTDQPQTLWASQTSDFENMNPDNTTGTVEADDALDFTLEANDVNAIQWMSAGEDTLVIGTRGGEWTPDSTGAVITPLDITVRRQTKHGSARVQPVRVGSVVLFVQRAARRIREFGLDEFGIKFKAPDMTRLAQHITLGGIVEMAYAEEPESLVWAVRGDGQLLSMTYRREEDVVGWARHVIGGSFSGGQAVVESVAVIPGANGGGQVQDSSSRDEVWLIVKRTINGVQRRYVEFMERDFETGDDQVDAYFADSMITYDGVPTTTITGLGHLQGQTVKIWADGAIQFPKVVTASAITLDNQASVVQIGLGQPRVAKTLKIAVGNPAGTPLGKTKRIYGLTFAVLNSHTLKFGPDDNTLSEQDFRVVLDPMDAGAPLFTGERFVHFPGDYAQDARILLESDDPAPFTLLAIAPEIQVNPLK